MRQIESKSQYKTIGRVGTQAGARAFVEEDLDEALPSIIQA